MFQRVPRRVGLRGLLLVHGVQHATHDPHAAARVGLTTGHLYGIVQVCIYLFSIAHRHTQR